MVGDRVKVLLALPCRTPLGCEGSTPLLMLLVRVSRAQGTLGMAGGPASLLVPVVIVACSLAVPLFE